MFRFVIVVIIMLCCNSSSAQELRTYRFLLFSPEQKEAIPLFRGALPLPASQNTVTSPTPKLINQSDFAIPQESYVLPQGDLLNFALSTGDGYQGEWFIDDRKVCQGFSCQIDTQSLSPEAHRLRLHISTIGSISYYDSIINITPQDFSTSPKIISASLVKRAPSAYIDRETPYLTVKQGLSFIKNGNKIMPSRFLTPLGYDEKIKTMTDSLSEVILPNMVNLRLGERSTLHFAYGKIRLASGLLRIRIATSTTSWELELPQGILLRLEPGSDTIIRTTPRGTSYITPIQGFIQISTKDLQAIATATQITREAVVRQSPQENIPLFFLFPGQALKIHMNRIKLLYSGHLNMVALLKKMGAEILDQKQSWKSPFSDSQEFKLPHAPIAYIEKQKPSPNYLNRGHAYMLLGLPHRALFFFDKEVYDHKTAQGLQRKAENLLIQKKWSNLSSLLEQWSLISTAPPQKALILYYKGVAKHFQGQHFAARDTFREVLREEPETTIRDSAQSFIKFYESNKKSHFQLAGAWLNSNNVLRAPQGNPLPGAIIHRASPGFRLASQLAYSLAKDGVFHTKISGDLQWRIWLRDGLSDHGLSQVFLRPAFIVHTPDTSSLELSFYVGKSMIGNKAGLDHFGAHITYAPISWGAVKLLAYDHSKNLDPTPNDGSFRDVFDGDLVDPEDRSVQRQVMALTWMHSPQLNSSMEIQYWQFRYQGAQDDNYWGFQETLSYQGAFSKNLDYTLQGTLKLRRGDSRDDTYVKLSPLLDYRWNSFLSLTAGGYFISNSSTAEMHRYQEITFQIGSRLHL